MVEHWEGVLALALAFLVFFVSVYVIVALNTGWRFGYWVTAAAFGGLMAFMSLFWLINGIGPAVIDQGWLYVIVSAAWLIFHLWGLHRAERKKISPVAE